MIRDVQNTDHQARLQLVKCNFMGCMMEKQKPRSFDLAAKLNFNSVDTWNCSINRFLTSVYEVPLRDLSVDVACRSTTRITAQKFPL